MVIRVPVSIAAWAVFLCLALVLIILAISPVRGAELRGYVLILELSDGSATIFRELSDPLLEPGSDGGPFTTPTGCAIAAMTTDGSWISDNGRPYAIVDRICVSAKSAEKTLRGK